MFEWRLESRDTFYDTLVQWWKDWGFPILPKKSLPNRIFVVSSNAGSPDNQHWVDLYAVPIFISDSDLCWLGFPTGNKRVSPSLKEGALDYIMGVIEVSMKYHGFDKIITTSDTPKLMELFERRGFTVSDNNVNYYTKEL